MAGDPSRILLLPGDGIGPEVTRAARLCLEAVAERFDLRLSFQDAPFGGAGIDAAGEPLPPETLGLARVADAVFLGAVGGPAWDDARERPEAGLLALRKALGLYANLRPVRVRPGLEALSPLKPELVRGADLLIVRELTGGLYFGEKRLTEETASDICAYARPEIARIAGIAFAAARQRRGRVASVDKANVLATSKLWRRTVEDLAPGDLALEHVLVDAAAMRLVTAPSSFDVILTENLFGDILSDAAAVIPGSIGLLGSASLGGPGPANASANAPAGRAGPGLFEPVHGSAPDIAGRDVANPAGAIESAALLLRHGLGRADAAGALEQALDRALAAGARTRDLGGALGCQAFAEAVAARVLETERA